MVRTCYSNAINIKANVCQDETEIFKQLTPKTINTRFIRIMFNDASEGGYSVIECVIPEFLNVNGNTYKFIA